MSRFCQSSAEATQPSTRPVFPPDAPQWCDRLHVVGADFRDLKGLEAMCDALPTLVRVVE